MNRVNQKAIKILRRAAASRLNLRGRGIEWTDVDAYLILLRLCLELGDQRAFNDIMVLRATVESLVVAMWHSLPACCKEITSQVLKLACEQERA